MRASPWNGGEGCVPASDVGAVACCRSVWPASGCGLGGASPKRKPSTRPDVQGTWSRFRGAWSRFRGTWSCFRGTWSGFRGTWSGFRGTWSGFRGTWSRRRSTRDPSQGAHTVFPGHVRALHRVPNVSPGSSGKSERLPRRHRQREVELRRGRAVPAEAQRWTPRRPRRSTAWADERLAARQSEQPGQNLNT